MSGASIADYQNQALVAITERIHRACLTMYAQPTEWPREFFTLWPSYRHTWWDEGNEVSKLTAADITRRLISPPRFAPTAREVDDALPALALLEGSQKIVWRIVRFRAAQEWYGEHVDASDEAYAHWRGGWRAIGAMAGCSHTTAREKHAAAMTYALNRAEQLPSNHAGALSKSLA